MQSNSRLKIYRLLSAIYRSPLTRFLVIIMIFQFILFLNLSFPFLNKFCQRTIVFDQLVKHFSPTMALASVECPADFDDNGIIDSVDLTVIAQNFGRTDCTGNCQGDIHLSADSDVDGLDLWYFITQFGRDDCPIIPPVEVPDVLGLSQTDAINAIVDASLIIGNITQQYSDTVLFNNVISQNPPPLTSVSSGSTVDLIVSLGPDNDILPPDPVDSAPSLDPTVATSIFSASEFLYTGSNPIQTGMDPMTIDEKRAAVLRGKVMTRSGEPLPGVTITIPRQSYYLQQTELTAEPFRKYGEDTVKNWADRVNMQFPSQWQGIADLAERFSAADPDFDYRLPTQAQWAFACKNGYDQTCALLVAGLTPDSTPLRPNKYGIQGLVNHDIECGDIPGQFFGQRYWHDWLYSSEGVPECICDHVTIGHPDSDDSLDEIIAGRFVLIPKSQGQ